MGMAPTNTPPQNSRTMNRYIMVLMPRHLKPEAIYKDSRDIEITDMNPVSQSLAQHAEKVTFLDDRFNNRKILKGNESKLQSTERLAAGDIFDIKMPVV